MIWHFYVRYSYVVVEKDDIMIKKGKLRKGIGILLAVCMALPVGFVTKSETVHGKVIDADITKRELWSTSFKSADGFKTSTVDDKKGTANISTTKISAGVSTGIGSHAKDIEDKGDDQFEISDGRSADEIYNDLQKIGMQPVMSDYIYG